MTTDALRAILTEVASALKDNKRLVTSELLDHIEAMLPLVQGMNAQTLAAAAMAANVKVTTVDLPTIVSTVRTAIQHERTLISGTGDNILKVVEKLLNHPIELELLSKLV